MDRYLKSIPVSSKETIENRSLDLLGQIEMNLICDAQDTSGLVLYDLCILPNEILFLIFSFITSPKDILSLKLCCNLTKSIVERVFDHSYRDNLPFWKCFANGQLQELRDS